MRMKFSDIYGFAEDITKVTDQNNLAKHSIQWGLDVIGSSFNFPYLMKEGTLTMVASQAEYKLPSDVDKYKIFRDTTQEISLENISSNTFDILEPAATSEGTPNFSILVGSSRDTSTTGTVSGTVNTSVITGSGTSWESVEGLSKMSRITIGTNVYSVKTIDSDTQITIYETLMSTVAGSAYSILLDNLIIRFHNIPDSTDTVKFRYQRIPDLLFNAQDVPDLPDQWHYLLVSACLSWLWRTKDQKKSLEEEGRFMAGLELMKRKIGYPSQTTSYPRRSMSIGSQRPFGPRTTPSRGIPFSL